ncbi:MAG: hypothetical protein AB1Z29_19455 [Desulfobacterales bacterium]
MASIGIEKDKAFAPDERMKGILTDAAKIGSVTARALTARPRDQRHYLYPDERVWSNPFIDGRYDFLIDGARLLDSRIYMHFYATGITPAMAVKNVGKGSQYAIASLSGTPSKDMSVPIEVSSLSGVAIPSSIGVVIFILADWLNESVTPIAIKTTDIATARNIFFIVVILLMGLKNY